MRRVDHDQGARSAGSSVGGLTLAPRLVVITDGPMPAVDHDRKRVWPVATAKRGRDEVFVEFTKSVCPVCKVVVDAQVNIREDKVYLRKRCREHGQFEALVYGDAQAYLSSARFNKPGTIPLAFQTEVRDGCPSDCGLCPEHKQHACLGIIEVNTNCNLDCPICFADSGHQPADLGESTVERARAAADEAGLAAQVRFRVGDAECLPLPEATFDALVCECAFCTFPGKATAAAEFTRVLRPGGRVGITDITVAETGPPKELTTLAAWVACIADSRSLTSYSQILADAGLRTVHTEEHDHALTRMIDQIEARLGVLRMTAADRLDAAAVDVDAVLRYTALAKESVADGILGFALIIAEKP
jgi:arsenite methyltransferase